MKPRRIELPTVEPQIQRLCGVLVLLSVVAPILWAWIAGPGIASPIKMFGLPLLKVAGIVWLIWFSPELRRFVKKSFWLDVRAWPVAFVVATIFIVAPPAVDAAWRLYVAGVNAAPDVASDWIAATAPVSNSIAGRIFIVAFFSTVSVASEEIVYRLILLVSLPTATKVIPYVFLSASLFALAHFTQGIDRMVIVFMLIGLPSAIYFFRSRNLGAIVVFHATFNVVALGAIFSK